MRDERVKQAVKGKPGERRTVETESGSNIRIEKTDS
jgi:hypothetical protein